MGGENPKGRPDNVATDRSAAPQSTDTPVPEGCEPTGPFDSNLVTVRATSPVDLAPEVLSFLLKKGDRVGEQGRFEITGELGAGGLGRVLSAVDRQLDRSVAIKFINPSSSIPWDELVALLQTEAKATAQLRHENIVAIFDIGAWNKIPYLVIEHLEGESLAQVLARERLDLPRATDIMIDVARGLAHAHGSGIIHRDLKPSNVIVLKDGRAKILDFGLAAFARSTGSPGSPADPGASLREASPTHITGTPAYMAPEQWLGEPQDERTDIWALGVVLFQAFTGELPYPPSDRSKLFAEVSSARPAPSVLSYRDDLPEQAERLVSRAMHKRPSGRFQTAGEVLDALVRLREALRHTPQALQKVRRVRQRRQLTFLSCGVTGFSHLPDDPEELSEPLSALNRIATDVLGALGGHVVASVGGKILACFGHPVTHEGDVHRAVRAGLRIVEAVKRAPSSGKDRPGVRVGIHTGVVIVEDTEGQSGPFHIQGAVPEVAASLESRGEANAVVIGQPTYQLVRGLFDVEALDAVEGPGAPLAAYRVLRESDLASRFDPTVGSSLTPLVGREMEADRLRELWSLARDSHGQFVLLTGEAGIGKSRLVAMLKEEIGADRRSRLTCQCWPHFRSSAFYPVIELLQRSTGIVREDPSAEKLQKLETTLTALGIGLEEAVPLLASLLSIAQPEGVAPLRLDPREQKKRRIDTIVAMLVGTAAQTPTLLVVEDLHWVDHSSLELLGALLEAVSSARLLVVATARPEFQPPWQVAAHFHRVPLDRLGPAQAARLVEYVAGERILAAETIDDLVTRTDGIPLFVEELTRVVVDLMVEGRDAPAGGPSVRVIPSTLNELFLARLDRLSAAGKEVAQLGAVLGRSFPYSLIRHVSALEETALQGTLQSLTEAGVLLCRGEPPQSRYQFRHSLIPEAAYHSLLKQQRQEYHLRVAKVLAEDMPETAETQPELLAHHYGEAGRAQPAIFHWERAGRRAVEGSANVEAISHFTQALHLLASTPEGADRERKELSLQLALGSPLMAVKGYAAPEVERTYARARALCRAAREEPQLFPAVQGLWQFYMVGGELPKSREMAEQLLALAKSAGDSALLLLAHRSLATSAFLQGEIAVCRELTEKGLALYDPAQHRTLAFRYGHDPGVAHGLYAAWALWLLGYPDQALSRALAAVELAQEITHPMSLAFARCYAALLRNSRGEHAAAAAEAGAATALSQTHRLALWLSLGTMMDGWARGERGEREEGIARLQQGVAAWRQTGARAGMTFFLVTLAEALGKAGRPGDGMGVLEQAAALVATNSEHYYEAELYRLKGELALALDSGARVAAEADLRRAVEIARGQEARSLELRAATSLGSLLKGQGRSAEARPLLEPVYDWFTEGFDTADLKNARRLLAEL